MRLLPGIKSLLIMFVFVILPNHAFAWSAAAHRIIVQIAYDNLQPKAKRRVIYLTSIISNLDHQSLRFEQTATWADQIVQQDVTAFNVWHFINKPFTTDKTPLPAIATQNVVWAIAQADKVLRSTKASVFEKSLFLRFLVHFVGDVHQPLHCAARVTREHPQGDAGGNFYFIKAGEITNLHKYWDQSLGLYDKYQDSTSKQKQQLIISWAKDLQHRYPSSQFSNELSKNDAETWADESFELARTFVYTLAENAAPDAAYIKQGQKLAQQRVVLAGYRLARLLNGIFSNS